MNAEKTGKIIRNARIKKNMTQKQLAQAIFVTDKAVCKWETGRGCPDITLLTQLSRILEIDIQSILKGEIVMNTSTTGNLRKIKFYKCPDCGNLITSTKEIETGCCGNKLFPLAVQKTDEKIYIPKIEEFDGQYILSFSHPMTKEEYISNIVGVQYDRIYVTNLFAEQDATVTFPQIRGTKIFIITNKCDLFEV